MKYATFPKLTIATVIGLSKTELGNAVLRIWSGKIWPMPKTRCSFFHIFGHLIFISIQIIFIEIFLLKSKPVLAGILYIFPDKCKLPNCLERTLNDRIFIEIQERYLLADIKSKNITNKYVWTHYEIFRILDLTFSEKNNIKTKQDHWSNCNPDWS